LLDSLLQEIFLILIHFYIYYLFFQIKFIFNSLVAAEVHKHIRSADADLTKLLAKVCD